MDKKLQSLLSLYGDPEVVDDGMLPSDSTVVPESNASLDAEPAVQSRSAQEPTPLEVRRLSEAKFVMENRARMRPDASVIDAIVREASAAASNSSGSTRPPLRLIKGLTSGVFPFRYAVAASIVLFAVAIGLSRLGGIEEIEAAMEKDTAVSEQKREMSAKKSDSDLAAGVDAPQAAELDEREPAKNLAVRADSRLEAESVAPPAGRRNVVAASPVVNEFAQVAAGADNANGSGLADALTGWDDGTRMRVLQRRVESLQGDSLDLAWDQPAVPLEQLVRVPSQPGVVRAKSEQQ